VQLVDPSFAVREDRLGLGDVSCFTHCPVVLWTEARAQMGMAAIQPSRTSWPRARGVFFPVISEPSNPICDYCRGSHATTVEVPWA
jgi:hypothetical protein